MVDEREDRGEAVLMMGAGVVLENVASVDVDNDSDGAVAMRKNDHPSM